LRWAALSLGLWAEREAWDDGRCLLSLSGSRERQKVGQKDALVTVPLGLVALFFASNQSILPSL